MANQRTEIQHRSSDGDHFQLTAQETDSPILPVAQLKALSEFRPDLIDWVVQRTESEGEYRRERQRRIDRYIFVERVGGLVGGIVVAVVGLSISALLALNDHEATAGIVGGGTLVSIVSIIVTGRRKAKQAKPDDEPSKESRQKKKR